MQAWLTKVQAFVMNVGRVTLEKVAFVNEGL